MSKLDDLFGKKKDIVPVLDLSKTIVSNINEFKRLLEKVPDYKMRPIKVKQEDIKIKENDWLFKMSKTITKLILKKNSVQEKFYIYLDPMPIEMRSIILMELCQVQIDWKMLTTLRPRIKIEEEFFSKLVELGKNQLKSKALDKRKNTLALSIRKVKNKSSLIERRVICCIECNEEFCDNHDCGDFNYDLYTRIHQKITQKQQTISAHVTGNILANLNRDKRRDGAGKKLKGEKFRKKKIKKHSRSKSILKKRKEKK